MLSHDRFRMPPTLRTDSAVIHHRTATDTLVLQFSRWRSRERGFLKSRMGPRARPGGSPGFGLASERSPQVIERPLRGTRSDTVAIAE
jgi:hypothetical protein